MERAASVGSMIWTLHPDHHQNQNHHNLHPHHLHHKSPSRPNSHHFSARSIPKLIVTSYDSDVGSEELPLTEHAKSDVSSFNDIDDFDNDTPSVSVATETRTYKRRFYIVAVFSLTSFMQYCCWNTFGPISSTCMSVFSWTEGDIALMASLDPVTYILTIYIFSWAMDVKGMRLAMLATTFFMVLGTGLRCVTSNEKYVTWTMGLGQFFNGLAGPVTQAGPPLISSIWFPSNQRTSATAIASLAGSLGIAMAFIIGPSFVKEIETLKIVHKSDTHQTNETQLLTQFQDNLVKSSMMYNSSKNHTSQDVISNSVENKEEKKNSIMQLLYIEFGINAFLFLCVLAYFPDKPPIPPSYSGHVEREDFSKGLKLLIRNRQYWALCLVYGVTTGVYSGWGAVLNVNLSTFGVTQKEAGWLGFYTVFAGVGAGMLLAWCADRFNGRMKLLLLILFTAASGFFLWFSLLCLRIISYSIDSLYQAAIFGGFFISGTIPLFYELTIEQTYPIAEGVTTGLLTLVNNIVTVIFLVVLIIPGIGTKWMNWVLFGACVVCIPVLILIKTNYNRLSVDTDLPDIVENKDCESGSQSKELKQNSNQSAEDILNNNVNTWLEHEEDTVWCFSFSNSKENKRVKNIPDIVDAPSLWSVDENNNKALPLRLHSSK